MAAPSVTYTFANSTTADATQVNQNFTDLINGLSDGTKDLSINALTCAGSATLNGNINLGNASGDDLTVTASLASTLTLKTTYSYDLGGATVGLRKLYLGASDSAARSAYIAAGAVSASYGITLPAAAPAASNYIMNFTSGGVGTFEPKSTLAITAKTTTYTATLADDVITVSGSGAAWTLSLPAASTATGKIYVIKRTDDTPANAVTIDPNASETVDGATTYALYTKYESVKIICDGSNWHVLEHKADTPWATYTPTFTGFGTAASVSFWWRRVADSVEVKGTVTTGTCTATEARMSLPTGVTADSAKQGTAITVAGKLIRTSVAATEYVHTLLIEQGLTYFTFSNKSSTAAEVTKRNANDIFGNAEALAMHSLSVPVSGWKE